jgi:phospholipid/cholesterol/gamma-HCH transport system ATP-binding protein
VSAAAEVRTVASAAAALELADVSAEDDARAALAGVSLALPRGRLAAVVGASGSGKSTLLRVASGLVRPSAGRVLLFGHALPERAPARAPLLARVGVAWQGGALFDDLDVAGNVGFALREVQHRPSAEVERAVRESLLLVGLKHVEHLRPRELPPSTVARVALARAVAHHPELLLLDEPAGGLDPVGAAAMRDLLAQLHERLAVAVLVATRDPDFALRIAERVTVLHRGQVAASGPAEAVRAAPDAAVQQLLAGRAHGPIEP